MVSILPMVDLLGNTVVDWFCILSFFGWTPYIGVVVIKGLTHNHVNSVTLKLMI